MSERRGWFRRRRDARVAENLAVHQAELATLGLDYDRALNTYDDLVDASRIGEALDFAEQARHSLEPGTRAAGEIMLAFFDLTQNRLDEAGAALDNPSPRRQGKAALAPRMARRHPLAHPRRRLPRPAPQRQSPTATRRGARSLRRVDGQVRNELPS